MLVATHSGPFHADDVMAWALIRTFYDANAELVRTRDADKIDAADIVVDVGGIFDPSILRFDHHQGTYAGDRSSAGMVLDWLEFEGKVSGALAHRLRDGAMTYLDDVDTGRVAPKPDVLCFPRIVAALNQPADTAEEFDVAFVGAGALAAAWLNGVVSEHEKVERAEVGVLAEMQRAEAAGSNLMKFEEYLRWKEPYYANGGAEHLTEFVLFPGTDDSWRIIAIPPKLGDFGQKRSLPEAWCGLLNEELSNVIGVSGARFCHKNGFIAVFDTRQGALSSMAKWNLLTAPAS